MINKKLVGALAAGLTLASGTLWAVPDLQVGAPAGPGDNGTYADYEANTVHPTETDTAITSGNTIFAAAVYKTNTANVGAQFSKDFGGDIGVVDGLDWSDFGWDANPFDGTGALLMATVAGTGNMTVDGNAEIYSTDTYEDGFVMPSPPSNHDPVKEDPDTGYLFFDIGDFAKIADTVPDFAEPEGTCPADCKDGEIKALSVSISGFDWVHFDLIALVTTDQIKDEKDRGEVLFTYLGTSSVGNPGSHDVTWKPGDDDDDDGGGPPEQIPEPGTLALLGLGLFGIGAARLRRRQSNNV